MTLRDRQHHAQQLVWGISIFDRSRDVCNCISVHARGDYRMYHFVYLKVTQNFVRLTDQRDNDAHLGFYCTNLRKTKVVVPTVEC